MQLCSASKLLLVLGVVRQTLALSSYSPRDLESFPSYAVVVNERGVLNETVDELLSETLEVPPHSFPPKRHLLRTPSGQAFVCTVPAVTDEARRKADEQAEQDALVLAEERERGVAHGLALLEPLRQGCLYLRQGWFTYSFCYGSEIRQFHAYDMHVVGSKGPTEDPHHDAYRLGAMPEPTSAPSVSHKHRSSSSPHGSNLQVPSRLGGGDGLDWDEGGRYLSQIWDGGTICDKTGLPREVEVQYHCNTQTSDRIALIRETSICRYVLLIHTPRLCGESLFLEGHNKHQEPAAAIECKPVVKKLRQQLPEHIRLEPDQPKPFETEPAHVGAAPPRPAVPPHPPSHDDISGDQPVPHHHDDTHAAAQADKQPNLQDMLDELLDTDTMLTLVYDPETGEIESAVTEAGEDVYIDSELRRQLLGDVLSDEAGGAPVEPHVQEESIQRHPKGAQQHAPQQQQQQQEPTVAALEQLTKMMHDTIAQALREHANPLDGQRAPAAPGAQAVGAGNPADALLGAIRRAAAAATQQNPLAAQGQPQLQQQQQQHPVHPGLHKYLQSFQKEKRTMQVPPEAVLGSEAHERLKRGFERRYEADDEGVLDERDSNTGAVARQHDEL